MGDIIKLLFSGPPVTQLMTIENTLTGNNNLPIGPLGGFIPMGGPDIGPFIWAFIPFMGPFKGLFMGPFRGLFMGPFIGPFIWAFIGLFMGPLFMGPIGLFIGPLICPLPTDIGGPGIPEPMLFIGLCIGPKTRTTVNSFWKLWLYFTCYGMHCAIWTLHHVWGHWIAHWAIHSRPIHHHRVTHHALMCIRTWKHWWSYWRP